MSDFYSGNSVNCVLLDVNLYETKRENNWSPIPEGLPRLSLQKDHLRLQKQLDRAEVLLHYLMQHYSGKLTTLIKT